MAASVLTYAPPSARYLFTVRVADAIRRTGYRFDASWRHADDGFKARFYARCCTFAANDIADDPTRAAHWRRFL